MKQKTLRVFEVENFEHLKGVVDSKYPLIKNHFFLLKEKNEEIEAFLKEKNLNYFIVNGEVNNKSKTEVKIVYKEKVVEKRNEFKIYDKIIRSGEEINFNGHLVFLKRINAGAKIVVDGNIEIMEGNEGLIICNGEYMLIKNNKGTIIFNGEEIGKIDKLSVFTKSYKKVIE